MTPKEISGGLRAKGNGLNFFAILAFIAAIIFLIWGTVLANATPDPNSVNTPSTGTVQFIISGAAASLCVLLAFFAQLYHIRAVLENRQAGSSATGI